eukprot:GEMP01008698.1.p1 GENE.GEMP01008698.1~~GEMP01008698.1.p1  ORF type:complete len:420 (+),score=53.42 GEMP01008698.1:170-1429(+)
MSNYSYPFTLDYPVDAVTEQAVTSALRSLQASFNALLRDRHMLDLQNRGGHADVLNTNGIAPAPGLNSHTAPPISVRAPVMNSQPRNFRCLETFEFHNGPVHSIDVSPDNTRIASASWDGTVSIYNLLSRNKETKLSNFTQGPPMDGDLDQQPLWDAGTMQGLYCVKFARSEHHQNILGCASADHMVYLWNFKQPQGVTMRLKGHVDEVNCIDFHPQQAVVCSTSDDCDAIVWDMDSGVTLRTLQKHPRAVYGAAFLGQEQEYLVATVCFDQKTRVYDMRDKQIVAQLQGHTDDVIGIDYSNRSLLATGSDDGMIVIWDCRTWQCLSKINTRGFAPDNEVKRVKFSKDISGKLEIAAGGANNSVYIFDIDLDVPVVRTFTHELTGHTDCVFDVAWGVAQNGSSFLVTASHDLTWKYWGA